MDIDILQQHVNLINQTVLVKPFSFYILLIILGNIVRGKVWKFRMLNTW